MPLVKRRVWDKQKVKEIQKELATRNFTISEAIRHFDAKGLYTTREIAEAIGKTPQHVYNVLNQDPSRKKRSHKVPADGPTEHGIWQRFLSFFKSDN